MSLSSDRGGEELGEGAQKENHINTEVFGAPLLYPYGLQRQGSTTIDFQSTFSRDTIFLS